MLGATSGGSGGGHGGSGGRGSSARTVGQGYSSIYTPWVYGSPGGYGSHRGQLYNENNFSFKNVNFLSMSHYMCYEKVLKYVANLKYIIKIEL